MSSAEVVSMRHASSVLSMVGVIAGIGAAVPSNIVTNEDLGPRIGVSDEWIRQRTGVRRRRAVMPGESTASLAVRAGRSALASAGVDRVDTVLVATTTPDRLCPGTAPEVASALGMSGVCAYDLNAVCSGFLYGLATANGLIAAGTARHVLLIGADTFSTIVNPEDRSTAMIFGDGAGAVVLRAGEHDEPGALGPFDLGSDGARSDLAAIPAGGSRQRSHGPVSGNDDHYLNLSGRALYQHATSRMSESVMTVLGRVGWPISDVDWLVAHQANLRIVNSMAEKLGIPSERAFVNIDEFGNTAAASVPLALADAAARGSLIAGQKIVITAFGGGLTWGSTALIWPAITSDFTNVSEDA